MAKLCTKNRPQWEQEQVAEPVDPSTPENLEMYHEDRTHVRIYYLTQCSVCYRPTPLQVKNAQNHISIFALCQ